MLDVHLYKIIIVKILYSVSRILFSLIDEFTFILFILHPTNHIRTSKNQQNTEQYFI